MMLEGKSAVITGAGSGAGRCRVRFAEEGAKVVVADLRGDWAKETVRQVEAAGGVAVEVECDVSQDEQVAGMIATAVDQFGRLDILFNNVGVPTPRLGMSFEEHTVDDFDRLVAVNLRGVFLGCKHAVIQFKQQGDGARSSTPAPSPGSWVGAARCTARPKAVCTSSRKRWRSRARRSASG